VRGNIVGHQPGSTCCCPVSCFGVSRRYRDSAGALDGTTAVWLSVLGVDFPVLWGSLASLLHFVPSVGAIVAAVPAVLLALVQLGGASAVLTAIGYLVIGMVLGNIVEPRIMGRRLGLSTLVVFVSLIFWGNLLGLVGALLCVPLTMTLKLACETSEDTQWIAVLLGPGISPESTGKTRKWKTIRHLPTFSIWRRHPES
jgi:AI-2E family transporter